MNNDLISRSALKEQFGYTDEWYKGRTVCAMIDNASTADDWQKYSDELWKNAYKEGYKQAIIDGKTNFSRPEFQTESLISRYQNDTMKGEEE